MRGITLPLTICLLTFPSLTTARVIEGKVIHIADGDTITILDASKQQHRIRINGIDAPEKGQPFGERSKQNLTRMAFRGTPDSNATKPTDTSGRSARNGFSRLIAPPAARRSTWVTHRGDSGIGVVVSGIRQGAVRRGSGALRVCRTGGSIAPAGVVGG